MSAETDQHASRWLIFPRSVYASLGGLGALSIILIVTGAVAAPRSYAGLENYASAGAICDHGQYTLSEIEAIGGCTGQISNRATQFNEASEDLDLACRRRGTFIKDLASKTDPATRRAIAEEQAEIMRLFSQIRELAGPPIWSEVAGRSLRMLVTVFFALGIVLGLSWHAFTVGVEPMKDFAGARRPFLMSTGAALVVALVVTVIESFDRHKTGFDWSSYCLAGSFTIGGWSTAGLSFWLGHATLFPLAISVGLQAVAGWHVTKLEYAPKPDPRAPHWGLRSYVVFLQVWCFSIVVLVGVVAAMWIAGLASSRTDRASFFLGFGALFPVGWILCRLVRNARSLRAACERLRAAAEKPEDLPPDPTDGLLSVSWWQVPTLFASAYAVAAACLAWAGLGQLWGGP